MTVTLHDHHGISNQITGNDWVTYHDAAVRRPYDFLGTQDRVKNYANSQQSQGDHTVTLQCGCGIAVSEKSLMSS